MLRRWSYADLTAYLKAHRRYAGENPIYAKAAACGGCLQEAAFMEAVSRSLRNGDFDLIVAGDGMREDVEAIAGHLRGQGARLAPVEIQIWTGAGERGLLCPAFPSGRRSTGRPFWLRRIGRSLKFKAVKRCCRGEFEPGGRRPRRSEQGLLATLHRYRRFRPSRSARTAARRGQLGRAAIAWRCELDRQQERRQWSHRLLPVRQGGRGGLRSQRMICVQIQG